MRYLNDRTEDGTIIGTPKQVTYDVDAVFASLKEAWEKLDEDDVETGFTYRDSWYARPDHHITAEKDAVRNFRKFLQLYCANPREDLLGVKNYSDRANTIVVCTRDAGAWLEYTEVTTADLLILAMLTKKAA